MAQQQENWKQKYLDHLDKLDKAEASWQSLENQLRLGINRVALAAQGVDSKLDKHLTLLRKSIRAGGDYDSLEIIVEDISTVVKKLDQQRQNEKKEENQPLNIIQSMAKSITFPKEFKKQVKTLLKTIKKEKSNANLASYSHELASLINSSLDVSNRAYSAFEAKKPSLIERLFQIDASPPSVAQNKVAATDKRSNLIDPLLFVSLMDALPISEKTDSSNKLRNDFLNWDGNPEIKNLVEQLANYICDSIQNNNTAKHNTESNPAATSNLTPQHVATDNTNTVSADKRLGEFCFQLLCSISFPAFLQDPVSLIKEQVFSGVNPSDAINVLRSIAGLVASAQLHIGKEKNDLQEFLQQLTDNLQEIDLHLAGAETERLASVKSNHTLDNAVKAQVNHIKTSMKNASSLDQLKDRVNERLDAIRKHLDVHNQQQEQHQSKLASALSSSNSRLMELETESKILQVKLKKKHSQAIHDSLTGIFNRLAYEERMNQEYSRWKRYKQSLSIMILDIDHFKRVNDDWGHKAGDKALKLIAKSLQKNLRESDFLARYGGEEFIVLMPETDIKAAIAVANKLREAVPASDFHYESKKVEITVSCGISQFKESDTIESAFKRADKYLYMAKQAGRNCCISKD